MPDSPATPKAKGRGQGNHRTGRSKGYRGQKGGAHQVAWRDDRVIMERLRIVVYPLWLKRQPAAAILPVANALMLRMQEPEVSLATIYDDLKRCEAMARDDQRAVSDKVVEHLAEYDYLIRLMYEALSNSSAEISNVNKDRLYGYIMQAVDRKAKLDGSLEQGSRYAGAGDVAELGPSPSELLASGRWKPQDMEIWLRLSAEMSGVPQLGEGQIIEGTAQEVAEVVAHALDLEVSNSPGVAAGSDDQLDEISFEDEEAGG